jgi:hypothetical protein
VQLARLQPLPQPLAALFCGTHPKSRHFFSNIRAYNSALQLASCYANVDRTLTGGIQQFRISGGMYHQLGPLQPTPGRQPQFAQLYILDQEEQLQRRGQLMDQLDHGLLQVGA